MTPSFNHSWSASVAKSYLYSGWMRRNAAHQALRAPFASWQNCERRLMARMWRKSKSYTRKPESSPSSWRRPPLGTLHSTNVYLPRTTPGRHRRPIGELRKKVYSITTIMNKCAEVNNSRWSSLHTSLRSS